MRSIKEFIEGGYRDGGYQDGGWRSGMHVTFDSQTEYENFKIQLCTEFPQSHSKERLWLCIQQRL